MRTKLGVSLAVLVLGIPVGTGPGGTTASAAGGASRTYTSNADFDEGTANNVVHSTPGQLQLDDTVTAFPFIWVALSARGTIAKIDTATGAVKGEYSSTSDGDGAHNPSRTTVGNDGSVWAGNRNQSSVIHVGLLEAGQCVDRNGNGTIQTSSGYGNVLAWPGGSHGASAPVSAAQDECVLHHVDTAGGDARHVSVDGAGDVWVGSFFGGPQFQKVDDTTGTVVPGTARTLPCGGYGGLVDGNGVLWSAHGGSNIVRWDPAAPDVPGVNPRCLGLPVYGLAFDSGNNIWGSTLNGSGKVYKLSPTGGLLGTFSMGHPNAQGLAVDGNDHVWISSSLAAPSNSIAHLKNDGSMVGQVTGAGGGSTGVSVDAAGKIWTANISSHDATRIDPTAGPLGLDGITRVGAFDLTVPLPGASPYNYSDMTGSTLTGKPASGSWTTVYDSAVPGAVWGALDWTADTPAGSGLTFTAASSSDGVVFGPPQTASDAADLTVADGRYLKVTATFTRTPGGESPVLYDVAVRTAHLNVAPVAEAGGPYTVPEGSSVGLVGAGSSDADGDGLTHAWDLDGDGSFETTGADPTFSAVGRDGPDLQPVTLRVCDQEACTTDTVGVTITNVAPTADAGPDRTVFRGETVPLAGTWTDPAASLDDGYAWTWSAPAAPGAGSTPYGGSAASSAVFATEGTYPLSFSVTDKDGADGLDTADVTVLNRAPDCRRAAASPATLWPPNHRFVPVSVTGLTDAEGDALTVEVTSIRQDEPVQTPGSGSTHPDGRGVGTSTAEVRAERAGTPKAPGDGRVYHVTFSADDGHGGACTGSVTVGVPHSMNGALAVDGGPLHDSTV